MKKKEKHPALAEFDKTVTQEEKDALSYLDWTDERLGAMTRATAKYLNDYKTSGFLYIIKMILITLMIM